MRCFKASHTKFLDKYKWPNEKVKLTIQKSLLPSPTVNLHIVLKCEHLRGRNRERILLT